MFKKLKFFVGRKEEIQEEEFDFLDSSAGTRLKEKCQEIFDEDQIDEFENYKILGEIGRGNMGIVYKALQLKEQKVYALKLLPKRVTHDPQAADRFFQEIYIHRQLSHPNIIQLYKVGVCEETVFIVMEYILGNSLEVLLQKRGRLSSRETLNLVIPIVEALEYAHSLKIVHRDLKPANILIEESSQSPKIADFGLAKLASENLDKDDVFGTPAYMAPEQVISSKFVNIRADIYAIGSILYHLLSGQRPYMEIQDPALLVRTKVKKDPKDIGKLVPPLEKEVQKIVQRAMARNLRQRYQTPTDLLGDLRLALNQIEQTLPPGHRKSPLRPSEKLKEEAVCKSTAYLPQIEEVPELFMTASRYEIEPALETFQKEVKLFSDSPLGSLVKEEERHPQDQEIQFEETLLTLTMIPDAALHLPKDLQKMLEIFPGRIAVLPKDKNLLDNVLTLLKMDTLQAKHKNILTELRYLLVLRGNSLTKQKSLIEFINQGEEHLNLKLDEMSRITQSNSFNKRIRQYFQELVVSYLKKYDTIFRKDFLACKDIDEVGCYLENYSLNSDKMLRKYKNLRLIKTIKHLYQELEKNPEQLEKILDQTLGPQDADIRKAFIKFYLKKGEESTFWGAVARSQDLATFMNHLMRFKTKPEFKGIATRVANLIEVFLDSGGRTSLDKLKTGLNFLPRRPRDKICMLVRKRLNSELEEKIHEIICSKKESQHRFKSLLNLVQNPRYHSAGIQLYGYSVKSLAGKIAQLRYQEGSAQELFREHPIPEEILGIICEDKEMEIGARAKTIQNCLKQLQQLEKDVEERRPVSLLKSLLKIFHFYGKINFSKEESVHTINGYQLARHIVKYYSDPGRTTLELPQNIHPEVAQIVQKIVNQERQRQLRKLGKK